MFKRLFLLFIILFCLCDRVNAGTVLTPSEGSPSLFLGTRNHWGEPRSARFIGNCQFLPSGHIFPGYLADVAESRIAGVWNKDNHFGWIWDATLGGRIAALRIGSRGCDRPTGFQIDFEGSAHLRLDFENEFELYSTDYRAGLPITWGGQYWQFKTGYCHVSSHIGDEYFIRRLIPSLEAGERFRQHRFRTSYSRDSLLLAVAFRPHPNMRLYSEADFNVGNVGSANENRKSYAVLRFGVEYSPPLTTNTPNRLNFMNLPNLAHIRPFAAIHSNLFEQFRYSGNVCIQIGLQNRGSNNQLFRIGVQYFYGVSEQYQFAAMYPPENKFGFGVWYDY